ncbi:hypothetical protein SK128_016952 [Halocaridina rubra]|uniref:Ig-like domain-containing protein n=1 Tax=Halocaridina rubra TaxID=373956 RepID=A0AAN8XG87_HALRR
MFALLKGKVIVDTVDVEVLEGAQAALPCDLRTSHPNDTVQLILWIKEGLHTPLYSYDYRELLGGRPKETKPDARSTLSRRTSFKKDRIPVALLIDRAQPADAGLYRCRVDFIFSPTINRKVNLTVIVPPKKVQVRWLSRNSSLLLANSPVVGPFLEATQPTLICTSDDGWPPPSVLWYENGELLDDSDTVDYRRGISENELNLMPLKRTDLGRELTCVSANTNKVESATNSVIIDMTLRIMGVKVVDVGTIWAGDEATAFCRIWGSRPAPNVLWWLGSQMLPPTHTEVEVGNDNVTISSLIFVPDAKDDGAMLICQATNELLPDQAVQDSTILSVNYAPLVTIQLGKSLDPQKIKEGDDIYFECSADAKPPVSSVIWKHNLHGISRGVPKSPTITWVVRRISEQGSSAVRPDSRSWFTLTLSSLRNPPPHPTIAVY